MRQGRLGDVVSVVVPLTRCRAADLRGIAGWTRQSVPGRRVEVVVVSPVSVPASSGLHEFLRPSDRVLVGPGLAESALWDLGARAGTGSVLVLTEAHSVPLP